MNFDLISSTFLTYTGGKRVESESLKDSSGEEEAVEVTVADESRNDDLVGATIRQSPTTEPGEEAEEHLEQKQSFSLAATLFLRGNKSSNEADGDVAMEPSVRRTVDSETVPHGSMPDTDTTETDAVPTVTDDGNVASHDPSIKSPSRRSFPFRAPTFLGRLKKTTIATEEVIEGNDTVDMDQLEKETDVGTVKSDIVSENSKITDEVVATTASKDVETTTTTRKTSSLALLSTSLFGRSSVTTSSEPDPNLCVTKVVTEEQVVAAEAQTHETSLRQSSVYFEDMATHFMKLLKRASVTDSKATREGEETVSDIVTSVREHIEHDDTEESSSLMEIIKLFGQYKGKIGDVAKKYVGTINLGKLSPTAVMYYVEREDELKNPSWKRRQHRFCPGIKDEKLCELNDALNLALLCYADTADEIRDGLDKHKTPYDLVYVSVKSSPGQPANFVAVKRDQSSSHPRRKTSPNLYVVIGVRGTKTAADAITDLLCDTADYKGGKAHSFILESGKYIAEKHRGLLEELRVQMGKAKVKVKFVGHSLGAGAASIAGMELYGTSPQIDVQVIGFGCPALVSSELAEKATYITTVVNDTDVVPRMSGITVANLLLDMMSFDWMPYAQRDIQYSLEEMRKRHSRIFKETTAAKILQTVEPLLGKHRDRTLLTDKPDRIEPEVYPPGKCIHFYRDGSGISGSYVPNTFFSQIDVTRRMIDDHVFHVGYQQTLLEIARQQEKDHHFRFEA